MNRDPKTNFCKILLFRIIFGKELITFPGMSEISIVLQNKIFNLLLFAINYVIRFNDVFRSTILNLELLGLSSSRFANIFLKSLSLNE